MTRGRKSLWRRQRVLERITGEEKEKETEKKMEAAKSFQKVDILGRHDLVTWYRALIVETTKEKKDREKIRKKERKMTILWTRYEKEISGDLTDYSGEHKEKKRESHGNGERLEGVHHFHGILFFFPCVPHCNPYGLQRFLFLTLFIGLLSSFLAFLFYPCLFFFDCFYY